MLRQRLPGAERANPVLPELLTGMEEARPDLTTDYLKGNLLDAGHPVLGWLKSCIRRALLDYARAAGVDYELDYHLQAWANINRFGDYHKLHNHPHSWLSGTYHVQVPEHRILPRAGEMLLWPAFLHHLVHPNLSDELGVSISFNVVLRWRDSYLP